MSTNAEIQKLIRSVQDIGLSVTRTGHGWSVRKPGSKAIITSFGKKVGGHARENVLAQLRRAGYDVAKPVARLRSVPTNAEPASWPEPPTKAEVKEATVSADVAAAKILEITPQMADEMLTHTVFNRPASQGWIDKLAKMIIDGGWHLTGDSIKFSRAGELTAPGGRKIPVPDGTLIDGRHRLYACIQAETSIQSYVAYGLDPTVFVVLDSGRRRSTADVVGMLGAHSAPHVAAALALVHRWEEDPKHGLGSNRHQPNVQQVEQLYQRHPGIASGIKYAYALRKASLMPLSMGMALHYLFALKSELQANEFFDALVSGASPKWSRSFPVYSLREALLRNAASGSSKMPREVQMALTVKAWNAFRRGKPMHQLSWRRVGENSEEFPTIE